MLNKYAFTAKIWLVLLLFTILSGCGSKRYVNKALKFDDAGMFHEAAALYKRSLMSNASNMDARMGLMRTGNLVLEEKLAQFTTAHRNQQHKEAVYGYLDAERYYHEIAAVGVKLDFPDQNKVFYNESKEEYLSQLYREGLKALSIEAFSTAEPLLSEILSIDKTYKDTQVQWTTAKYEPIYRHGMESMANGLHRKAYYTFDKIINEAGPYKESLAFKDQSLKAATITIGVLPVYVSQNSYKTTAGELKAKTISEIHQLKSPFYKLISDPVLNTLPQLERIGDPNSALRYLSEKGVNLSVQTILYAKISRFNEQTSPLSKTEKPAYIKKITEFTNESGVKESKTDYTKTNYLEFKRFSKASISIEYTLVHIKTGEILVTDVFSLEEGDQIEYAEYKGDYKSLVPGEWQKREAQEATDKVYSDAQMVSALQQKFNAKKEFREGHELTASLLQNASQRIAAKIEKYTPEK